MPHCDNCFTALRHVLSSAFCQHLSALLFHRIQPAVMLHGNAFSAMPSAVISHGYEMGSEKKKKERGRQRWGSVTMASLLKPSNCLFKCCHGESQWRMAHLFFPFELSSWIFSPVDRFHSRSVGWDEDMETENPGGSLSFQNLPH